MKTLDTPTAMSRMQALAMAVSSMKFVLPPDEKAAPRAEFWVHPKLGIKLSLKVGGIPIHRNAAVSKNEVALCLIW